MTEQVISPLRRRMIDDMAIRKFTAKTQHDYVQRVKDFATFLRRSPGTASAEDVRRFRLHMASSGAGTPKSQPERNPERHCAPGRGRPELCVRDTDLGRPGVGGSNTNGGWLVGAGVEYAFAPNWSTRLEYYYLGLSNWTANSTIFVPIADRFSVNQNIQTLLLGVHFRF
jgi:opacity protein-like surface antigen